MSKKSRRRNKKILGALGALGALALMGRKRNRDASIETNEAKEAGFDIPAVKSKKPKKVYQDDIMRGGKGTKFVQPDLRFGQVINKEGNVQTIKPFESAGLNFGISKRKTNKTQAAVNRANREMSEGMLPPQLRNPGRTNITTKQGDFRRGFKNLFNIDGIRSEPSFSGLAEGDFAAKDGGRITKKGVKRGAAKRGFGRAYTKGRR
jgi:hypothetical protein